jgi:hypothetical protein
MVAMGNDSTNSAQSGNALFPWKLQEMLTEVAAQGRCDIVSWLPDGKAFKVHKVSTFVSEILPSYFKQTKYKSFQRQLNLWGFERLTSLGTEKGAYCHIHFLRDQPSLCRRLTRQRAAKKSDSKNRQTEHVMKQTCPAKEQETQPKFNVVEDDESVQSVTAIPAIPAVDFEGCTFFPLETECYEEMTLRVTKLMQDAGVTAYKQFEADTGFPRPSNRLIAL